MLKITNVSKFPVTIPQGVIINPHESVIIDAEIDKDLIFLQNHSVICASIVDDPREIKLPKRKSK